VISNGSCDTINTKLLQQEGQIDELIIEKDLIGKINSILKVLRTAEERLITITDADVLFVNGWEQAVLNVLKHFPKRVHKPCSCFRTHFQLTSYLVSIFIFKTTIV
jgi:hypothetical protein